MVLCEMLDDLPMQPDVGCKRNARGHATFWTGYELHLDVADGSILVRCIETSASLHDSPAAIPLGTMTSARVRNLNDLMDSACDGEEIHNHSTSLGHVPIIDANPPPFGATQTDVATGGEGLAHHRLPVPRDGPLRRAFHRGTPCGAGCGHLELCHPFGRRTSAAPA